MVLYIHGCGDNGQKLSPNQLEFSSFQTPKALEFHIKMSNSKTPIWWVLRFCAQILCSDSALKFRAQILCSNSVLRFQHSWVFSYIQDQLTNCGPSLWLRPIYLYTRPFDASNVKPLQVAAHRSSCSPFTYIQD